MQDQAWQLYETCAHIKEVQPFELEGMLTGSTGKSMAITLKFRWGRVSLPGSRDLRVQPGAAILPRLTGTTVCT